MPLAMQIWNHYRKMTVSQFLQNQGVTVVPTLNWSRPESFAFCCDGIPVGGAVSTSAFGMMKMPHLCNGWTEGMNETVRRLKPNRILCYGKPLDFEPLNADVVVFQPEHIQRMRGKKKQTDPRTQFLVEHPGIIFNAAKKYLIPYDEWDDLQQETILKSLQAPDPFNSEKGNIATWANRFAIQTAFHFKRTMIRKSQRERPLEE